LKYLGGLAKNRKVQVVNSTKLTQEIRLDVLAESLSEEAFTQTTINLEQARTVWVATIEVKISRLEGHRKIAIVMNAPTFCDADDIDYFITNVEPSKVTSHLFGLSFCLSPVRTMVEYCQRKIYSDSHFADQSR
jgi:hypothetical protein